MHFPTEPTVYLDVTAMLGNRRQTGIQRVVRELARIGPSIAAQFRRNCRLVHAIGPHFYKLRFEHIDHERRVGLFRLAERRLGRRLLRQLWPLTTKPTLAGPDDLLLTLNATWDVPEWFQAVAEFRRTGFVASVLYDLTPLSHPQFHTAELSERFRVWLATMERHTDHWIGISQHVAAELRRHLAGQASDADGRRQPSVSAFRLGSQLDRRSISAATLESSRSPVGTDLGEIRPALTNYLSAASPTVLMVGTLEPRKNHLAMLSACRELWARDWPGQLLLLGRRGWQNDAVLQAIAGLPRERLLWLEDATDTELSLAYQRCALLAFPSWEEGFGLPIVEALTYGTPVLASDHPVHREVGGEACQYFPATEPSQLARLIEAATADGFDTLRRQAMCFRVVTWEQSCRQLIADAIVAQSRRRAELRLPKFSEHSASSPTKAVHPTASPWVASVNAKAA